MAKYYEYTGKATVAHYIDVEFSVAVPSGSTDEEAKNLMRTAAENAAIYGGDESHAVLITGFTRGKELA